MQDDLIERLREMDAATGLRKECLERATYLLAMKDEGQSTIMRQAMGTLFNAADRIAALEAELERRKYDGEHTCHEHCPRPACVLRREKAALEADNARLMGLVKEVGEALETVSQALLEVQAAQSRGASWYTNGASGLYQQVAASVERGQNAIRATLAKIKEATDAE